MSDLDRQAEELRQQLRIHSFRLPKEAAAILETVHRCCVGKIGRGEMYEAGACVAVVFSIDVQMMNAEQLKVLVRLVDQFHTLSNALTLEGLRKCYERQGVADPLAAAQSMMEAAKDVASINGIIH